MQKDYRLHTTQKIIYTPSDFEEFARFFLTPAEVEDFVQWMQDRKPFIKELPEIDVLTSVLFFEALKQISVVSERTAKLLLLAAFAMSHFLQAGNVKGIHSFNAVDFLVKKLDAAQKNKDVNRAALYQKKELFVSEVGKVLDRSTRFVQYLIKNKELPQRHHHAKILMSDLKEFLKEHDEFSWILSDMALIERQRKSGIHPEFFNSLTKSKSASRKARKK